MAAVAQSDHEVKMWRRYILTSCTGRPCCCSCSGSVSRHGRNLSCTIWLKDRSCTVSTCLDACCWCWEYQPVGLLVVQSWLVPQESLTSFSAQALEQQLEQQLRGCIACDALETNTSLHGQIHSIAKFVTAKVTADSRAQAFIWVLGAWLVLQRLCLHCWQYRNHSCSVTDRVCCPSDLRVCRHVQTSPDLDKCNSKDFEQSASQDKVLLPPIE